MGVGLALLAATASAGAQEAKTSRIRVDARGTSVVVHCTTEVQGMQGKKVSFLCEVLRPGKSSPDARVEVSATPKYESTVWKNDAYRLDKVALARALGEGRHRLVVRVRIVDPQTKGLLGEDRATFWFVVTKDVLAGRLAELTVASVATKAKGEDGALKVVVRCSAKVWGLRGKPVRFRARLRKGGNPLPGLEAIVEDTPRYEKTEWKELSLVFDRAAIARALGAGKHVLAATVDVGPPSGRRLCFASRGFRIEVSTEEAERARRVPRPVPAPTAGSPAAPDPTAGSPGRPTAATPAAPTAGPREAARASGRSRTPDPRAGRRAGPASTVFDLRRRRALKVGALLARLQPHPGGEEGVFFDRALVGRYACAAPFFDEAVLLDRSAGRRASLDGLLRSFELTLSADGTGSWTERAYGVAWDGEDGAVSFPARGVRRFGIRAWGVEVHGTEQGTLAFLRLRFEGGAERGLLIPYEQGAGFCYLFLDEAVQDLHWQTLPFAGPREGEAARRRAFLALQDFFARLRPALAEAPARGGFSPAERRAWRERFAAALRQVGLEGLPRG
ncbi:MAG: hypothetical protein D6731_10950 [Planctomycetota bacterium]|nr:MAG: hypothetical protein D6731_10950 [Planctomycetota bacterium]